MTKDDIENANPPPAYNYRVEIGSATMSFAEVSGLDIGYETATYDESPVERGTPGPGVMLMPSQPRTPTITLKKGVVPGASVPALYSWISSTQTNLIDTKDVLIRLCDETGTPVISWKAIDAFPTKLDAPTFTADSNDAAVESMELAARAITIEEA